MSRKYQLVDKGCLAPKSAVRAEVKTDWSICAICQENTSEKLTNPTNTKRSDGNSAYKSLSKNLIRFNELQQLPRTLDLQRLDEGLGIEKTLAANTAKWHQSCVLRYNNTKLKRAEKKVLKRSISDNDDASVTSKRTRLSTEQPTHEAVCFFCEQPAGNEDLHSVSTFKLNERVLLCAKILADTKLITKVSERDMIAQEAKYHARCLASLYNRTRNARSEIHQGTDRTGVISGIAFAELVIYIEETYLGEDTAPVFKLSELANLYKARMEQLGKPFDGRVHTTRLKERLLAEIPNLHAYGKGRDTVLAFEKDIGYALFQSCELDNDSDAVHLARAAKIVRRHIFEEERTFCGFDSECEKKSVPSVLLALVNMILEGPNIKDQRHVKIVPAALSIAQLLKFNSIRRNRSQDEGSQVRHNTYQETPLPIYLGFLLHAKTRKKELVDKVAGLGLSISYDRVLRLSAQLGESASRQYDREQVVCPSKLRKHVFTTAAVDNIDHNCSSTTAKQSFHGTGISLFQHPSAVDEGEEQQVEIIQNSDSKTFSKLPNFFTNVPVTSTFQKPKISSSTVDTLSRNKKDFTKNISEEYEWLENTRKVLNSENESLAENISWSAYHAHHQRESSFNQVIGCGALLPLFPDSAHTVEMIRHSMNVISKAVKKVNADQTPVITFDQPLYAIAKQIQWTWPEKYGEDQFVVFFGGLHIEMAALRTLGDWLKGSGWSQALVQAGITTAGTADSFLKAAHVTRTRRAHQVTAAALYTLQQQAYQHYSATGSGQVTLGFQEWCQKREQKYPQHKYWATVLHLELCMLVFVRAIRQSSFNMYLDALTELVPWFFALDHTNYARWVPVHLRDMAELKHKHPQIFQAFSEGKFTYKKTTRAFSAIAIDHAHEQHNACIKEDGGAVGLTNNSNALHRWMVAGPEIARLISDFEDAQQHSQNRTESCHHDQTPSVQTAYEKDVRALVKVMEELGNPFEEESNDLFVLDTKELAGDEVKQTIWNANRIGQRQFEAFVKERLTDRTKPVEDVIHRNKLKCFGDSLSKITSKASHQIASVKKNMQLFSRLYISCQTRDGNLEEFFRHENQACPPALSDEGRLHFGTKSDLIACLEEVVNAQSEAPASTCLVLDGAVVIQMLKPGSASTFGKYAREIFVPYLASQMQRATRLDIVWDRYLKLSLKGAAREKRGQGIRRRVTEAAPIPGNWQQFLREDSNKTELFTFLSKIALETLQIDGKQLVVTDGEEVLCNPPVNDLEELSPCSHEEADTRMLLHVAHAANNSHKKISIRTVDTDVVILGVSVVERILPDGELWIAFGVGKHLRYLAAHQMARSLGPEKAFALPMFHALTGCDTTSSFVGHGKKTAWAAWKALPDLTNALLTLACAPKEISKPTMQVIEKFVIRLYDRNSVATEINQARQQLLVKKSSVELIPPTLAALEQHVRRAAYQGGHVWGQVLLPNPTLPSPTDWGWVKSNGLFEPYWTTLPTASDSCRELISCGCKMGCVKNCRCKKASLTCTALCACGGACTHL